MKRWLTYLCGLLVLEGGAAALVLSNTLRADALLIMGLYWLWTGLFTMLDRLPGKDNGRFDRYEKRAYGLALAVMGLLWSAISFTAWSDRWIPVLAILIPPALIALAGRRWAEWKRNDDYLKNQTEKD